MTKKHMPKFVPPIILLLVAVGIYFLVTGLEKNSENSLTVSGTMEAVSSVISPEIGGKITQIFVFEGDPINAGDPLFRIDDTLLQAQREIAAANLALAQSAENTASAAVETAQANLDLALSAARQESAVIRAADWQTDSPEGYTLPGGSFSPADLIAAAQSEVDAALAAQTDAQTELADLLSDPGNGDFVAAEKALLTSKFAVQSAQDVLTKAASSGNADLKEDAQTLYDEALTELEDAQNEYDDLLESPAAEEILLARRDVVLAEERVQAAKTRLASLQTGEYSLKVQAAEAALQQAQAAASQAAQSVVQAQANLALVDTQIAKLTVLAPIDGIVLTRSIEMGEVISSGAQAVTVGQLDPLTITVYVPESEIGLLTVGQSAEVMVDSFPGEVFTAEIIHIADEAEFTPRNVQTTESRKTTVFAVKLQITNPDGDLKPGMPADVTFIK